MRKLNKILFIYVVLVSASCKKTRTCTCDIVQTVNTTVSYNNGAPSISTVTTSAYTDVKSNNHITKKTANQTFDCHNRNETYTDVKSIYSGTLTTTTTDDHSDEYKCSLK